MFSNEYIFLTNICWAKINNKMKTKPNYTKIDINNNNTIEKIMVIQDNIGKKHYRLIYIF